MVGWGGGKTQHGNMALMQVFPCLSFEREEHNEDSHFHSCYLSSQHHNGRKYLLKAILGWSWRPLRGICSITGVRISLFSLQVATGRWAWATEGSGLSCAVLGWVVLCWVGLIRVQPFEGVSSHSIGKGSVLRPPTKAGNAAVSKKTHPQPHSIEAIRR